MNTRSLWPWLLAGGLLVSGVANVLMVRSLAGQSSNSIAGPAGSTHPADPDPGTIPAFHLEAASSDEQCPTLDLLGLTDEQRNRIRSCSLTSLDLRTDLGIEIHRASTELEELLSEDSMKGDRILELADHISDLRSRQYRAWIGSILVVREVLTPEQLKQLHELESN